MFGLRYTIVLYFYGLMLLVTLSKSSCHVRLFITSIAGCYFGCIELSRYGMRIFTSILFVFINFLF